MFLRASLQNAIKLAGSLPRPPLRCYSPLHEPEYLDALLPRQPVSGLLNVRATGHDFVGVERFAAHVHKVAKNMGIHVRECWATPAQSVKVEVYKPQTTVVDKQFSLKIYERNVQVYEVPCHTLPIFLDVIQSSLPEGVKLRVHPHEAAHEEVRYIPDLELLQLKSDLANVKKP